MKHLGLGFNCADCGISYKGAYAIFLADDDGSWRCEKCENKRDEALKSASRLQGGRGEDREQAGLQGQSGSDIGIGGAEVVGQGAARQSKVE
jgi:hypothetical protein